MASKTATIETVFRWLEEGVFTIHDGRRVYKGIKQLAQRENLRKGCNHGDARVDLCHESKRRSCNVSQLVWMVNAGCPIPKGFEIHHRDKDPTNNVFNNLLCVHYLDHAKLHNGLIALEDAPF